MKLVEEIRILKQLRSPVSQLPLFYNFERPHQALDYLTPARQFDLDVNAVKQRS